MYESNTTTKTIKFSDRFTVTIVEKNIMTFVETCAFVGRSVMLIQ